MRWGAIAVAILCVAPLAAASAVVGELRAERGIVLAPDARLVGLPAAVYVPDASTLSGLTARSEEVVVRLYEDRYPISPVPGVRPIFTTGTHRPTWTLHDVVIEAESARPGWIGLHPDGGALEERSASPVEVGLARDAVVGNAGVAPDDDPALPYYSVSVRGAALARTSEDWTYSGAGDLKLSGPTVTLTTSHNTSVFETGEMPDPDNPAQTIRRHMVIEFRSIALQAQAPTQVVSREVDATWDGPLQLRDAEGALRGDAGTWQAEGEDASLDGAFSARIRAEDAAGTIGMTLEGDLRSSTLSSRASVPADAASQWPIFLIAAVALAAIGTTTIARRVRSRAGASPSSASALTAEELAVVADQAADAEDYARAADLMRLARQKSPTSRRLALDHAFFVSEAGDPTGARGMLEDPLIRDDPDALQLRARLDVRLGRPAEAAEALVQCLATAPATLFDIETDPMFEVLLDRPEVRVAVRDARRRLD